MQESTSIAPVRRALLVLSLAASLAGCETIHFYSQALAGQAEIIALQKSNRRLAGDPATPAELRGRLALTEELRAFARDELELRPSVSYTSYANLRREHVVFVIFAAPEFSLEPKSWWYPVVGTQDYRGFFSEADAQRAADALRDRGYDVYVGGVDAYSTLGWFRDPVLNTFIDYPETDYAELIFHELTHQKTYLRGRTDFNEALATMVAREGVRRWLRSTGDDEGLAAYERKLRRREIIRNIIEAQRARLADLYATGAPGPEMRAGKAAILRDLRSDLERYRDSWSAGLRDWLSSDLTNAHLTSSATYYRMIPRFEELLEECGGELAAFFRRARELARE